MAEHNGNIQQQQQHQHQLQAAYKVTSSVVLALWYILWPIGVFVYYLANAILFLAKLLYRPFGFLLQPLVYLGRFILACLVAPFHLLVKFETLYIYLGVAALIGLAIGLMHHYVNRWLQSTLGLEVPSKPSPHGRTAREYRVEKRKKKLEESAPLMSSGEQPHRLVSPEAMSPNGVPVSYGRPSGGPGGKATKAKGLLTQAQTIMEEADSDY